MNLDIAGSCLLLVLLISIILSYWNGTLKTAELSWLFLRLHDHTSSQGGTDQRVMTYTQQVF